MQATNHHIIKKINSNQKRRKKRKFFLQFNQLPRLHKETQSLCNYKVVKRNTKYWSVFIQKKTISILPLLLVFCFFCFCFSLLACDEVIYLESFSSLSGFDCTLLVTFLSLPSTFVFSLALSPDSSSLK